MISTAIEPLEFIPLGRKAVEEHPGPNIDRQQWHSTTENILLQRMQNVNISATEENNEFWHIREIYEDIDPQSSCSKNPTSAKSTSTERQPRTLNLRENAVNYLSEYLINSEEELYVKKHTAVWTKGLSEERKVLPRMCFTCDTPIKLAFFCDSNFVKNKRPENLSECKTASSHNDEENDEEITTICIIDQTSMRVYCSNGEDYIINLEFPVSAVWQTCFGILMEKVATNTVIHSLTISMPRIFSLANPLGEISPVLCKSATSLVSYIVVSNFSIIYSSQDSDLLLLYDAKIGKHFIARLRKATDEEVQIVAGGHDESALSANTGLSHQNMTRIGMSGGSSGLQSVSQQSLKMRSTPTNASGLIVSHRHSGTPTTTARSGVSAYTTHVNKFLNTFLTQNAAGRPVSPLFNLQSSISPHSVSMQDLRRMGQAQPSKPIIPDLCLEHIWTENTYGNNRDFCEISTRAFRHTDLIGQTYICYLLPRSCKLQLIQITALGEKNQQISAMAQSIHAKDAVCLDRMKMIAVLDSNGSLLLYTGTTQICKVHVAPHVVQSSIVKHSSASKEGTRFSVPGNLKSTPTLTARGLGKSPIPRRSSLLPTAQKSADSSFERDIHMLSPVTPLNAKPSNRICSLCIGLRDPAGNRLTLMYATGKMYRITLPLINETTFITRCLSTLRQILNKQLFLKVITTWYVLRNPPGSLDYSIAKEWQIFRNLLCDLMGLKTAPSNDSFGSVSEGNNQSLRTCSGNQPNEAKKRRVNDENMKGTDDDWNFMLKVLGEHVESASASSTITTNIDTNAILFPSIPSIFFSFHLLYEDLKLDETMHDYLEHLAKFLNQLAVDMQLSNYAFQYAVDFPKFLLDSSKSCQLTEAHAALMSDQQLLQTPPPSIFKQLEYILKNSAETPYNYIENVNDLSRNIIQLFSLIMHGHENIRKWIRNLDFPDTVLAQFPPRAKRVISTKISRPQQLLQMLDNMNITRNDLKRLPATPHLIIAECLEAVRLNPPVGWPASTYELTLRTELMENAKFQSKNNLRNTKISPSDAEDSLSLRCPPTIQSIMETDTNIDDGMENVDTKLLSLRFPDDQRIAEVRCLLCSAESVPIDIIQSPGTSDHEFIEEQEKQLFAICTRTMALSFGRGMFTLQTVIPPPTKAMPIPKLCLTGKEPTKGATIEMQQIEFPANMSLWPTFHNGVAAGLKISPHARDIDSTWIVYNKPKSPTDTSTEHAGFLMALGLNGHLKTLTLMSMYEYLVKCDEMTSVGLLLGVAATHRGTMNNTTTKLLSVHIEALLPATALELDIPQCIQVASLMGIGLLYQGSAKRHVVEVLLQEVGRPPGPEMENSVERESYALTAGLALGLVTLGLGESPAGLQDLQLASTLHFYMVGGNKRQLVGAQKEKYKLPSFQVREGELVNIDVTAPGATLALGLMFFNTTDRAIAEWMNPPSTRYQLDLVRPDLLQLRTIARGLILWSEIRADMPWLFDQFPENLKFDLERGNFGAAAAGISSRSGSNDDDIDHEAITQAYCNIIAGAAFCIGLKYASTEDPVAFKTLRRAIKMFLGFPGKYVGEYAGRTTIETCLMLILISISLVFAGSGDLEILRIIRYLRSRIGPAHSQVTYGSHMAIHMSLGLLFLGAGRFTIAKTPEAIAALVCAFYPKFPNHSNDNRYHLQAFRHLYVLAVEPRLFLTRDIDTKKLCLCNISIQEVGSSELRHLSMAPCMLPELSGLRKVVVDDTSYWPVTFERGRNWNQLIETLACCGCIGIKKRSGCLSLLEDPDRLKSLLSSTLTAEQYLCWKIDALSLERFSNESHVITFLDRFLLKAPAEDLSKDDVERKQHLILLFYDAVIKDKMHVLPIYLDIYNHILRFKEKPNNFSMWQLKLLDIYFNNYESQHILINKEILSSNLQRFILYMNMLIKKDLKEVLKALITTSFVAGTPQFCSVKLGILEAVMSVASYYNLQPNLLNLSDWNRIKSSSYIDCLIAFEKRQEQFDAKTTCFLLNLIQQEK